MPAPRLIRRSFTPHRADGPDQFFDFFSAAGAAINLITQNFGFHSASFAQKDAFAQIEMQYGRWRDDRKTALLAKEMPDQGKERRINQIVS